MKATKYDYWVKVDEIKPPLGNNNFAATAVIHEIGGNDIEHGLGEVWGKTREEAQQKMLTIVRQWIQVNEK